jgi:hypothetical protein
MSAISKQALLVDNNESFPNNNAGAITPSDLRAFNVNVIDSTVNQTEYTTNSGSWNVSIGELNAFTASQQPTFNALNSFTASQLNINSGVNSFTQSAAAELDSLSAWTGSWNDWTSSINEIRDNGVLQGYSTRFFFEGLVSASITPNVGGPIATINVEQDGTKLNSASFNAYTASTAASQSLFSASVVASINSVSSSFNAFSTSLDTNFVSEVEFASYSASVSNTIEALSDSTGAFATTGSNTFTGNQTITSGNGISMNIGSTIRLFEQSGVGTSAIQFWSGSNVTDNNPRWVNIQPEPGGGGRLAISAFPENNHFMFFDPAAWTTQFESVVTGYGANSRLKIGAGIEVTGSTILGGQLQLSPTAASNNGRNAVLFVSGSTVSSDSENLFYNPSSNVLSISASAGISNISPTNISSVSGSGATTFNTSFNKTGFSAVATAGEYFIAVSQNASKLGAPSVAGNNKPGILAISSSNQPYVAIEFEPKSTGNPDKRVTIKTPLFAETGLTITGSVYGNVSASTITSSTASIDLSVANYFTLTLAGETKINVINPKPGVTATLVINTDTAASASFSSNVKQPSGSFYAASPSGNIDIISFTAVDSTNVYAFPAQSFV